MAASLRTTAQGMRAARGLGPGALRINSRQFAAYESPAAVQAAIDAKVTAKPELYGAIREDGIGYERFRDLMQEVCPTVGDREGHALFTSMDTSGDGMIQTEELFTDIVLRVLHTRTSFADDLHPVEGSFASLPRPPYVEDGSQQSVVRNLSQIYDDVVADWETNTWRYTPKPLNAVNSRTMPKPKQSGFGSFFSSKKARKELEEVPSHNVTPDYQAHRGLYISGGSGAGKTSLLDVFFRSLPSHFPVVRLSYTEFCRDAFDYMTRAESESGKKTKGRASTPFDLMANKLHKRCRVLLLDGLDITQPSEVLLVKEFFRAMWLRGITIIITARQPIHRLYRDGHNRQALTEFFPEFRERCPEVELMSPKDYRHEGASSAGVSLVGSAEATRGEADQKFQELAGQFTADKKLRIPGETRTIPTLGMSDGDAVVRFDFSELCGKALGRSDYAYIATHYHTVFVENIPEIKAEELEVFRRFEALIDMMYDKKVNLFATSAVPLTDIYPHAEELPADEKEAVDRYKSVVTEMVSTKYPSMAWLMRRHLVSDSASSLFGS